MNCVDFLILFVLNIVLFSCEGQVYPPSNQNMIVVLPGSTARLNWTFTGDPSRAVLAWFFTRRRNGSKAEEIAGKYRNNPATIENSSLPGVTFEPPATLVLKNVDERYNGKYRFIVVVIGAGGEAEVELYIAEKPIVRINCSRPRPIKVNEGDNFTCVCRGEGGNPPPDVIWYKNGTQFGETRKKNNTLTRTNVDETDNVTYTCLVRSYPDQMYEDSESVVVQVKFKPKETTIEFTQNPAKLNTSVDIKCKSRGFPEPSYTITLNGTKTVSTDKTHTISKAWWNDTGIYNCTATNERGSDWDAKFLDVIEQGPTTTSAATTTASSTPKKSSESTKTSTTKEPAPTPTSTSASTSASTSSPPDLSTGAIIGIIIGVLVLIIIVGVVVYCCKSKEKERSNSCANIDPVPGNSHELGEPGPNDGAYDTVWPVGTSESKSKPPVEKNALPPVYAAVDKNNREGNTLYASLDNEALKSSRASKKEPDRPQQTEYASIDFAKTGNAPKEV